MEVGYPCLSSCNSHLCEGHLGSDPSSDRAALLKVQRLSSPEILWNPVAHNLHSTPLLKKEFINF